MLSRAKNGKLLEFQITNQTGGVNIVGAQGITQWGMAVETGQVIVSCRATSPTKRQTEGKHSAGEKKEKVTWFVYYYVVLAASSLLCRWRGSGVVMVFTITASTYMTTTACHAEL